MELREHYNKSKKEKQIIPQCTPEKEEAIMDALRHFKMIDIEKIDSLWLSAFMAFLLGIGTAIIPFLQGINEKIGSI